MDPAGCDSSQGSDLAFALKPLEFGVSVLSPGTLWFFFKVRGDNFPPQKSLVVVGWP